MTYGKMATYRVGPKGQVVIPKRIRERLHLEPGDEVVVSDERDEVRIRKAASKPDERRAIVAHLRGALAGAPSPTAALESERRRERDREDRDSSGAGR
jgi:AbrB family looped-hinge helix DNA binding protein